MTRDISASAYLGLPPEPTRVVSLWIISLSAICIFFKVLAKITLVELSLSMRVHLIKQFEINIEMKNASWCGCDKLEAFSLDKSMFSNSMTSSSIGICKLYLSDLQCLLAKASEVRQHPIPQLYSSPLVWLFFPSSFGTSEVLPSLFG